MKAAVSSSMGNSPHNASWSAEFIQALAATSGKPLEVLVAQAFLAKKWKARLGSHFAGSDGDVRELDVLAERTTAHEGTGATFRVRALVSCRGFAEVRSPLSYSVSPTSVPNPEPRLPNGFQAPRSPVGIAAFAGFLPALELESATELLRLAGLGSSRRIVALDVIEREERTAKRQAGSAPPVVTYRRAPEADRQLYSALSSALRAAEFWHRQDQLQATYYATINVPICVLSIPFWDVSINDATVGQPTLATRGYQSNAYPFNRAYKEILALLWAAQEVVELLDVVDRLFFWSVKKLTDMWPA